jgi:hypothetical protein
MKSWRNRIAVGVIFLLMFASAVYYWKHNSLDRGQAKLKQLEQIDDEIPIPPDCVEVKRDSASSANDATIHRYFRSPHNREQIMVFFGKEFVTRGWQASGEIDTIRYRKGEFVASVHWTGEGEYDVNYGWKPSNQERR